MKYVFEGKCGGSFKGMVFHPEATSVSNLLAHGCTSEHVTCYLTVHIAIILDAKESSSFLGFATFVDSENEAVFFTGATKPSVFSVCCVPLYFINKLDKFIDASNEQINMRF